MENLLRAVAVLLVLFFGLFQQGAVVADRLYRYKLTVTNGEPYGTWREPEMCPDQYFAIGFSVRVEANQGRGDDTALNGIRLICGKDGDRSATSTVESHPGFWGEWSNPQYCPIGVLTSFQLRVEGQRGRFRDDTAVNNIRFRCNDIHLLEGTGLDGGKYGGMSQNCGNGGICGIETRMMDDLSGGDDTALNDVRFHCCSMHQQQGAGAAFRPYTSVLTVPNGEQYGTWRELEMCRDQYFAVGFSVRVQAKQGRSDDTAMNGIRLRCAKDGDRRFMYSVNSHTGYYGDWSQPQYCSSGVLTSFQLRVEAYQGSLYDDTAVNNIKFRCSNGHVLEGSGLDWGEYGGWSQNCGEGGICGIETRMDEQGYWDDSTLNDVRFRCCDRT